MNKDYPKYFLFDTETGGFQKEMSLLTLSGFILDENLSILDHIHIKTKPDDGIYKVSARALMVNKIDLCAHEQHAMKLSEAQICFKNFIWKWALANKLTPVGHNVRFDVKFAKHHLLNEWDRFFERHHIDTASIGKYLSLSGILPKLNGYSLSELAMATNVKVDLKKMHDAEVDAEITLQLLKKMTELTKEKNT